jgi:hypothetical protein
MRDARLHVIDDGHLFLLTRVRDVAPVIQDSSALRPRSTGVRLPLCAATP